MLKSMESNSLVRPSHLRLHDASANAVIEAKVEEVAEMPSTESITEVEEIGQAPPEEPDNSANFVIAAGKTFW